MTTTPSIGRIVHYVLSEEDAVQINRRRTIPSEVAHRIAQNEWPLGAQAHIGNTVNPGDVFPAIIVRYWGGCLLNLHVFLDGNDTFWATSRHMYDVGGDGYMVPGSWHWPEST